MKNMIYCLLVTLSFPLFAYKSKQLHPKSAYINCSHDKNYIGVESIYLSHGKNEVPDRGEHDKDECEEPVTGEYDKGKCKKPNRGQNLSFASNVSIRKNQVQTPLDDKYNKKTSVKAAINRDKTRAERRKDQKGNSDGPDIFAYIFIILCLCVLVGGYLISRKKQKNSF